MYHYVRDLAASRYPKIKGLDVSKFRGQLEYLKRHYQPIRHEDAIAAARGEIELPANAMLMTFDDGYLDHYETVFPMLTELGWQGMFFAPGKSTCEREVMDVNKVHFILAACDDLEALLTDLFSEIDAHRDAYKLDSNDRYRELYLHASRLDKAEVIFIKRVLQMALPYECRRKICSSLFAKYVSADERDFGDQLYLSEDHIREMVDAGMYFGNHSYDHIWLGDVDDDEQQNQLDQSLDFLQRMGAPVDDWIMCYPYSSYNDALLERLKQTGCALGLSARVDLVNPSTDNHLLWPRLDTIDLPFRGNSDLSPWTTQILN